jgi:hypothetical protein
MPSVDVSLAGKAYSVPMLNIGQLELVTDALAGPPMRATFAILKIALKRATPPVPKPDEIEATRDEVAAAVDAILVQAGFKEAKDPNAPTPEAPGTGSQVES